MILLTVYCIVSCTTQEWLYSSNYTSSNQLFILLYKRLKCMIPSVVFFKAFTFLKGNSLGASVAGDG